MNEKLLPCPFCGSDELIIHENEINEDLINFQIEHIGDNPCDCIMFHDDKNMLIQQWNTRQPELNLQEVEKLVREVSGRNNAYADSWRKRIGYTLTDLEAKGGEGNKADLTERLVEAIKDKAVSIYDGYIQIYEIELKNAIEKTLSE